MLIREILSRFRNLNIAVEIDSNLLGESDCDDNEPIQKTIPVNLYRLVYAIGTIQTRRFAPSNRQKFQDFSDLIEKIQSNTTDFKVKINETRITCGSEVLGTMSENFGVGISVIVAMNLFTIKYSTIQRIHGKDKRPDWECQTTDNRILIVESKGAISQATSDSQLPNALNQKSRRNGDIKVASLTLLKENQISTNRFLDPPITPDNMDFEMKNKILRAGHYSSVFSFIGHSVLSKYFSQMRKRLSNSITPEEQNHKNNIYSIIRNKYSSIQFHSKSYVGSFYQINDNNYLFIGIDDELLLVEGFINFNDYDNEIDENINNNQYILFKDGVLIIEIINIEEFSNIIEIDRIKNYQEFNTISDIDSMVELSFEKYFSYLLKKCGFKIISEDREEDLRVDIVGIFEDRRYLFELKLFKRKKFDENVIDQLGQLTRIENIHKVVLITNAELPERFNKENEKLVMIGRNELKKILKKNEMLMEIIS